MANDNAGTMTLRGFRWKQSVWTQEFEAVFDSREAREAIKTIEGQIQEIQQISHSDHQRVLMVFTRSGVKDASIGRPSGERVRVDELSEKDLPIVYGSELAESRIRHEIREADDNVFKKGFLVDLNVKTANGKPAAYSVTEVHEVIDLPDDG